MVVCHMELELNGCNKEVAALHNMYSDYYTGSTVCTHVYSVTMYTDIPVFISPESLVLCTIPTETLVAALVGKLSRTVVVLSQSSALEKIESQLREGGGDSETKRKRERRYTISIAYL